MTSRDLADFEADLDSTDELEQSFSELIKAILDAIKAGSQDDEMELRAELKNRFRLSDDQVNRSLFKTFGASKIKKGKRKHNSVDLQEVKPLTYLMDGWIIRGAVSLLYGRYGTGKTCLALWKAWNLAKGKNILDRDTPCSPAKSLFIATDGGTSPLISAMEQLGIKKEDPLLIPGKDQMIFIWSYEPEQGQDSWIADITGLLKLESFIRENRIGYVVIDSAKRVSSAAGWSYISNESVSEVIKTFHETIAKPFECNIEFISHDGTAAGSHAGAKSWAEDPSMVIQLTPAKDIEGKQVGIKAQFTKDRAAHTDPRRTLSFNLDEGEMVLLEGSNVVGNCKEAITQILWEAYQRGNTTLSRKDITGEAYRLHRASSKTVDNTLGAMAGRRELVRPHRGHYALSPAMMQSLSYKTPDKLGGNISKTIDMTKKKQLPDHIPEGNSVLPKGKASGTHQIPLLTTDLR